MSARRLPIQAVLLLAPCRSPERLRQAHASDARAAQHEAEARRAEGAGLDTVAAAHDAKAQEARREVLRLLVPEERRRR